MSTVIGSITLDNDLYWEDEFQDGFGIGSADRTIDGTMVVQQAPIIGGRLFTLSGDENHGWQKRSTVQALLDMSQTTNWVSVPFTVTYRGVSYSCLFRYEDSPALTFAQVAPATAPTNEAWYYGTIKLRIVA